MDIKKLIQNGENLQVEFKSDTRPISDEVIVANVVCLANRKGGYLLLGVEDSGEITGASPYPRHSKDIDIAKLKAMIYSKTRPHIWVDAWVEIIKDKPVIVIKIPSVSLASTSSGKYLWRIIGGDGKPACVPMEPHEIISKISDLPEKDFSSKILALSTEALDKEAVEKLIYMLPNQLKQLPEKEIFQIMGITDHNGHLTVAGLLMCGQKDILKQVIPYHEVVFNLFKGDILISQDTWQDNIINIWHNLNEKQRLYNTGIGEIIKHGQRYEIPFIDSEVWRESIANAIVHRSYTTPGAITITWYTDGRVEIQNPGGLVKGVNIDNILSTPPIPRNPLLAEVFRKLGIVEKTGRGIDKIYKYQAIYGKPLPIWDISDDYVRLMIIGSQYNRDFFQTVAGTDLLPEEVLLLYALIIHNMYTVDKLSQFIQRTEGETLYFLNRLKQKGLWKENKHVYSSPVISPMEKVIIELLKKHGELSTKQLVSLTGKSRATVVRALSNLIQQGFIVRIGKGRATRYKIVS